MYDLPKLDRLLTSEDFEGWLGRPVLVDTYPRPVTLELASISKLPAPPRAHRAPFSLFFRSPWDVMLLDGLYKMSCGRSGPYEIALIPITPEPPMRIYQAVFN